jgi:phosphohistidine swiveling domain-containing protein
MASSWRFRAQSSATTGDGMNILWLKVSDEVEIPGRLSESEQGKLAAAFDPANPDSSWSRALRALGMSQPGFTHIIRFVNNTPYFNGTALALASSHGTVYPVEENGAITYRTRLGLLGLLRVLFAQWKLEKFLARPAGASDEPLEESIALGLAIQALMMRLPSKGEAELAAWLASPNNCPPASRSTVEKILGMQRRRNLLSRHWSSLFEPGSKTDADPSLPKYFWDEPPAFSAPLPEAHMPSSSSGQSWKGIPVCPGLVEGELVWVEADNTFPADKKDGLFVLAFGRARPETTEVFSRASALLFSEGGALSHACSVAREQGVPCVSGLGRTFTTAVHGWKNAGLPIYVSLNGATGEVSCRTIAR